MSTTILVCVLPERKVLRGTSPLMMMWFPFALQTYLTPRGRPCLRVRHAAACIVLAYQSSPLLSPPHCLLSLLPGVFSYVLAGFSVFRLAPRVAVGSPVPFVKASQPWKKPFSQSPQSSSVRHRVQWPRTRSEIAKECHAPRGSVDRVGVRR